MGRRRRDLVRHGGGPPFYADPEVAAFGYLRALHLKWLREEVFMVRMYLEAFHLRHRHKIGEDRSLDEVVMAVAGLSYLFRLTRLAEVASQYNIETINRWRDEAGEKLR
jgi:hypothetical protein